MQKVFCYFVPTVMLGSYLRPVAYRSKTKGWIGIRRSPRSGTPRKPVRHVLALLHLARSGHPAGIQASYNGVRIALAISFDAGRILLRNAYGWFDRTERGVYRLNGQGEAPLPSWTRIEACAGPRTQNSTGCSWGCGSWIECLILRGCSSSARAKFDADSRINDKRGTVEFKEKVVGAMAVCAASIAYERAGGK